MVVPYDAFEVGDNVAALAHGYLPPAGATCTLLTSNFSDEPPTSRSAMVCRASSGSSHFVFHIKAAAAPLRLRRTIDVGDGVPGSVAGAPAAQVVVNGVAAGWFSPVVANPARRWQQQEIFLSSAAAPGDYTIDIIPEYAPNSAGFSESAWELRGGFVDLVFAHGFEPQP